MDISENIGFVDNSASSDCGELYAQSNSNVNIGGNTSFVGNTASLMVEELVHGQIAMWTSVVTPLLLVTQLVLMMEESTHSSKAM